MNFWNNLRNTVHKELNSADVTSQTNSTMSGQDLQQTFYPGVPVDQLRQLGGQVFLNRWNNMPRPIRDEMTLAQFEHKYGPDRGWDIPIPIRTYGPPPSSTLSRVFNYAYNKAVKYNPFTRNEYVIAAQNDSESDDSLPEYYRGNNASAYWRSRDEPQVILLGAPETYNYNPNRPYKLYKNQASGGNLLTKEWQDQLNRAGHSKEVVDLLYNNNPNIGSDLVRFHELGHALDATSGNRDYFLTDDWNRFNEAMSNNVRHVNDPSNSLYLLHPPEFLNGVGTAVRSLRTRHWADTGKLPVPGDATDVNNVRQFFNMNPQQMSQFLKRVDRRKLDPAVRLWGTLRMLNDEKKKQEILDFISKNMVPYMVQNNSQRFRSNQRFRNNPRVWS